MTTKAMCNFSYWEKDCRNKIKWKDNFETQTKAFLPSSPLPHRVRQSVFRFNNRYHFDACPYRTNSAHCVKEIELKRNWTKSNLTGILTKRNHIEFVIQQGEIWTGLVMWHCANTWVGVCAVRNVSIKFCITASIILCFECATFG